MTRRDRDPSTVDRRLVQAQVGLRVGRGPPVQYGGEVDVHPLRPALGQVRAGARWEHLVDQEPHASGGHESGPPLREPAGLLGSRVVGRNLGVDLLPVHGGEVDGDADVLRV